MMKKDQEVFVIKITLSSCHVGPISAWSWSLSWWTGPVSTNPVSSALKQPGRHLGSICCHFPRPLIAPQHPQVSIIVIVIVMIIVVIIVWQKDLLLWTARPFTFYSQYRFDTDIDICQRKGRKQKVTLLKTGFWIDISKAKNKYFKFVKDKYQIRQI